MNSGAIDVYRTAMSDDETWYPKTEGENAFAKSLTDDSVIAFKNQSFTKGNKSLRRKNYNPEDLKLQHIGKK